MLSNWEKVIENIYREVIKGVYVVSLDIISNEKHPFDGCYHSVEWNGGTFQMQAQGIMCL